MTGPLKRVCKLILFGGIVKSQFVITHVCGELSNSGRMSHEGKDRPWHLKEKFIGSLYGANPVKGDVRSSRPPRFMSGESHRESSQSHSVKST